MSDDESIPAGREVTLAYALLRRAAHRMSGGNPIEDGTIDVDEVELMMGNAQAAYLLLKYAHPDQDLSVSESDRVADLLEEHDPLSAAELQEVNVDE